MLLTASPTRARLLATPIPPPVRQQPEAIFFLPSNNHLPRVDRSEVSHSLSPFAFLTIISPPLMRPLILHLRHVPPTSAKLNVRQSSGKHPTSTPPMSQATGNSRDYTLWQKKWFAIAQYRPRELTESSRSFFNYRWPVTSRNLRSSESNHAVHVNREGGVSSTSA